MLHFDAYGAASWAPPILIAHGLFGSARNWGAIARRLSEDRRVIAPDMRNHGASPWFDAHDYPAMATDLAELIEAEGGPADVVGHSMGGKAAMALALTRPDLVRRLIVADIAPVGYGHSQTPLIAAMRGLDLAGVTRRGEADTRLAARIEEPGVRAFLLQSLDLKADPPRWRLNLDVLESEMDRIIGWPDLPGAFDGPALFLAGGASDYLTRAHRPAIKAQFAQAHFAKLAGAGHWLHADKPRDFEATLRSFLG